MNHGSPSFSSSSRQTLEWGLSFASGYFELGMHREAIAELDKLPASMQEHPDVMALRSDVLLEDRQWPAVISHARRAMALYPEATEFYVHAATAFDMLGLSNAGRTVWQSAPESVRSSGFFHLHVARLEAKHGNEISARDHLAWAINLDPTLRSVARRDPALAPMLGELAKN